HIPTYIRARHGLEENRYPHPDLAEILDETYGVIVYQDQVLLIAQKFAGYSLGEADVMRKAMGKKVRSIMKGEEDKFLKGAGAKGIVEERSAKGGFSSLDDFFERLDAKFLNKRALDCLARAGAFDDLAERASLLASLDRLCGYAQATQKQREAGQASLFDMM